MKTKIMTQTLLLSGKGSRVRMILPPQIVIIFQHKECHLVKKIFNNNNVCVNLHTNSSQMYKSKVINKM